MWETGASTGSPIVGRIQIDNKPSGRTVGAGGRLARRSGGRHIAISRRRKTFRDFEFAVSGGGRPLASSRDSGHPNSTRDGTPRATAAPPPTHAAARPRRKREPANAHSRIHRTPRTKASDVASGGEKRPTQPAPAGTCRDSPEEMTLAAPLFEFKRRRSLADKGALDDDAATRGSRASETMARARNGTGFGSCESTTTPD